MINGIDVTAKLYRLKDCLEKLTIDDQSFVSEMVNRHERGQPPNVRQILRIVDIHIAGEDVSRVPRLWTQGMVSVVFADPEDVIWRYMPLEQMFTILSKQSLHFSPLSMMPDKSEGQLPLRAWEQTRALLSPDITEAGGGIDGNTLTAIMVEQRRSDACINCWYMNKSDSLEMWQQYAPGNGVAIQSTARRLASSVQPGTPITICPVEYFGRDKEENYTDQAFCGSLFIKHDDPFGHEKELRALAFRANIGCGVDIPVDLQILIERLVLSPELQSWAAPFVAQAIRNFGVTVPIERSDLQKPSRIE